MVIESLPQWRSYCRSLKVENGDVRFLRSDSRFNLAGTMGWVSNVLISTNSALRYVVSSWLSEKMSELSRQLTATTEYWYRSKLIQRYSGAECLQVKATLPFHSNEAATLAKTAATTKARAKKPPDIEPWY